MLRCSQCHRDKPREAFYRRRARARGYSSECKDCHKAKPRYVSEGAVERRRDRTLQRRYGITATEYDAMLEAQRGVCVLCGGEPNGKGRLHTDHDHETGRVRGLLCHTCNTGLGRVEQLGIDRVLAYLGLS